MKELVKTEESRRYYLLDAVRGLCILGMIFYHTLFDIVMFFGVDVNDGLLFAVDVVRDFGAACFICLSGICIHFGRKPLKRAILISAGGLIVSLVTYFVIPDMPVIFGILTFMGLAAFIMLPIKRLLSKLPALPCAILCFTLFMLFFESCDGYIGYYGIEICKLPEFLYRNYITALLGFPFNGFVSGDYFPILPWIFMFLFGFFLWNAVSENRFVLKLLMIRIRVLEKIGKLSLYIYIGHQPVIMGILLGGVIILNKLIS